MTARSSHRGASSAFTLVEVLMATIVMVILVALIGNLFNGVQKGTELSLRHLDADTQARFVFDRMANDFNTMVKSRSIDYIFSKAAPTANDSLFFFSQAPAQTDDPSVSHSLTALVGYRVNSKFQLERLGKLLDWSSATSGNTTPGGLSLLTFSNGALNPSSTINGIWNVGGLLGTAPSYADGADADFHVLGDGVFRFSFCFLENIITTNADGTATVTPTYVYPPSPALPSAGTYPLNYVSSPGVQVQVTAIVVALGILDTASRKNGAVTASTVAALPTPGTPPILTGWNKAIQAGGFAVAAGLPSSVAGHVRVYQRTFYLGTPQNLVSP